MRWTMVIALVVALATVQGCKGADTPDRQPQDDETSTSAQPATPGEAPVAPELTITSTAFTQGEAIPAKYTCDGDDLSVPLAWAGVPDGAASLVVIFDDPDAPVGTWVHGVLFDLAPDVTGLDEGDTTTGAPATGVLGATSWKNRSWGGPCPPKGPAHRYFFRVYALDTRLDLEPGATREQVDAGMQGHVLSQGVLMGRYQRAH